MRYSAIEMIEKLVGYPTVSRDSNLELIEFVQGYLAEHGVESHLVPNADGTKANLYATVGPGVEGGVVLSGHTDVVPVDGQPWDTDPFTLTERGGRLYGRGTCDMKSFSACGLALVPEMVAAGLKRPIHFALSYDEEVGCQGAPSMIAELVDHLPAPRAVIVGEPSDMRLVNAHKGISGYETVVTGHEAHSSQTHRGVSAVMNAARLIHCLDEMARECASRPRPESGFVPPYTTIHVGMVKGGDGGEHHLPRVPVRLGPSKHAGRESADLSRTFRGILPGRGSSRDAAGRSGRGHRDHGTIHDRGSAGRARERGGRARPRDHR